MILQRLREDAGFLVEDLPPSMYDRKPVRWVVHLHKDGHAEWPPERLSGDDRRDRGKPLLVPFKVRTSAIRPLLLVDKPSYVWGVPEERTRSAAERAAFLELLDKCARDTGSADVAAVARFAASWGSAEYPLPPEMEGSDLITFAVDGRYPIAEPSVRSFWAREAAGDGEESSAGQCLVCGRETSLVERLPVFLRGLPQGQASGVALVSANASAFESYGREAGLTSPICLECGERFGKAANALLSDPKKHLNVGPVSYLFWTPAGEVDFVDFLSNPDPEQVRLLLESARAGRVPAPIDDSPFYAASLTAYTSRAVVRSWVDTTIGAARRNLERWFELQRVVDGYGAEGRPLSVFRLAVCLYREAKDIVARVPDALLHNALHGGALPTWLLQQAVVRNQAEQDISYSRAALLKAVLCSQGKEEMETMAALCPHHPNPAYHCGRLLAELEAIQEAAVRGIKATIVDRYYAGASTAPARVFGLLLSDAQPHLGKLRRENRGAYERLTESLEGILSAVAEFPRTLTVQDQALFSMGYYHQRAADRAARREAIEAKRAASQSSDEETIQTEEDDR